MAAVVNKFRSTSEILKAYKKKVAWLDTWVPSDVNDEAEFR